MKFFFCLKSLCLIFFYLKINFKYILIKIRYVLKLDFFFILWMLFFFFGSFLGVVDDYFVFDVRGCGLVVVGNVVFW